MSQTIDVLAYGDVIDRVGLIGKAIRLIDADRDELTKFVSDFSRHSEAIRAAICEDENFNRSGSWKYINRMKASFSNKIAGKNTIKAYEDFVGWLSAFGRDGLSELLDFVASDPLTSLLDWVFA